MSERKVTSKYYPWDFDPNELGRKRGPKQTGPKIQPVRLMAPFTMRCTTCGEFIYRGRKFNARKEVATGQMYLGVQVLHFHIKCTRCSSEITFRTDPKTSNYAMVSGAVRNIEPWYNRSEHEETDEQRLDRLELEEAEAAGEEEHDAMADLESRNADARREMEAADALDSIRQRNARVQLAQKDGFDIVATVAQTRDEELARQDREDAETARRAFAEARARRTSPPLDGVQEEVGNTDLDTAKSMDTPLEERPPQTEQQIPSTTITEPLSAAEAPATFRKPLKKKKKDHAALLGIKKKPALV